MQRITKWFETASLSHGIPIALPVRCEVNGSDAHWFLSDDCVISDVVSLIHWHQTIATARSNETLGPWIRQAYPILEHYVDSGGFLAQERREKQIGAWAEEAYSYYQSKCLEMILWAADYQYTTSNSLDGEECRTCLRRAARFHNELTRQSALS